METLDAYVKVLRKSRSNSHSLVIDTFGCFAHTHMAMSLRGKGGIRLPPPPKTGETADWVR